MPTYLRPAVSRRSFTTTHSTSNFFTYEHARTNDPSQGGFSFSSGIMQNRKEYDFAPDDEHRRWKLSQSMMQFRARHNNNNNLVPAEVASHRLKVTNAPVGDRPTDAITAEIRLRPFSELLYEDCNNLHLLELIAEISFPASPTGVSQWVDVPINAVTIPFLEITAYVKDIRLGIEPDETLHEIATNPGEPLGQWIALTWEQEIVSQEIPSPVGVDEGWGIIT